MPTRWKRAALAATLLISVVVAGCSVGTTSAPPTRPTGGGPVAGSADRPTESTRNVDPRQAACLQQVMIPLIKVMNHPVPASQVKVGLIDSQEINAANAGHLGYETSVGRLKTGRQPALDSHLPGVYRRAVPPVG
jgi:hypothetical protein